MLKKTTYIIDLKPNAIGREELFSVKDIQKRQTRNGDPYYQLRLKDKTGTIVARIWKDSLTSCEVDTIAIGDAVLIDFECNTYQGEIQLNIRKMKKCLEYDISELMTGSDIDTDGLWNRLQNYIESINDPDYKLAIKSLFADQKFTDTYKKTPAAELVHHDFVGGLLQHVIEMLGIAEAIIEFYPMANRDLVVAGIIIHDMGKVEEVGVDETTFIRTKMGYLLGHITIGIIMLNKALPADFDPEKKMMLEHIILSHHQEIEHGAVVKPATIEAMIVSAADRASSHIRQYEKEIALKVVDKYGFGKFMKYQGTKIFIGTPQENTTVEVKVDATPDQNDTLDISQLPF